MMGGHPCLKRKRFEVVPPGNLRYVHARLDRLRDDRDLLGIQPLPAPLRPGDHPPPAEAAAHKCHHYGQTYGQIDRQPSGGP